MPACLTVSQFSSLRQRRIMLRVSAVFLLLLVVFRDASLEPRFRSEFSYDEQLLEKMIRMEAEMDKWETRMNEQLGQLTSLREHIDHLKKTEDSRLKLIEEASVETRNNLTALQSRTDGLSKQLKENMKKGSVSYYTTCKDGWIPFKGSCYLFSAVGTAFTEAEQYCRQHENSHLVHVDDACENGFLKDQMRLFKDFFWWVGIKDEDIEGVWKWFDTDELATFTDFKPGDGGDHHTEDCATFYPNYDYQWVDVTCSSNLGVLCETRGHEEASVIG